jgi:hypothetical protein
MAKAAETVANAQRRPFAAGEPRRQDGGNGIGTNHRSMLVTQCGTLLGKGRVAYIRR